MWLLLVGVAVGVLVTALLRAWSSYEASSTAGLIDRMDSLELALEESFDRIEALEAIAASEGPDSRLGGRRDLGLAGSREEVDRPGDAATTSMRNPIQG